MQTVTQVTASANKPTSNQYWQPGLTCPDALHLDANVEANLLKGSQESNHSNALELLLLHIGLV